MNHGHFTVGASLVEVVAEPQELAWSLAGAWHSMIAWPEMPIQLLRLCRDPRDFDRKFD